MPVSGQLFQPFKPFNRFAPFKPSPQRARLHGALNTEDKRGGGSRGRAHLPMRWASSAGDRIASDIGTISALMTMRPQMPIK